jgi:large subunit ribosomal protein L18
MAKYKHKDEYRRRREGKTNYQKRLKLLLSRKPRLVVRKSSRHIRVELVDYSQKGDKVIASAFSKELEKLGWKAGTSSIPASYLTGLMCGTRAKGKCKEAIFDMGLEVNTLGSKLYAALKGTIDSGIKISADEKMFPSEDRLNGTHIANYAKALKKSEAKYKKQFSAYMKKKSDPEKLPEQFETMKKKIAGGK